MEHIMAYIELVESGERSVCREQVMLAGYVRRAFESGEVWVDEELLGRYLGLVRYFPYEELFEWERFCLALHLCTFWAGSEEPRWSDLFLLVGRGAGKDGFIAFESFCLLSPYSGLSRYDVDVCANVEEQAKRPMYDICEVLDHAEHSGRLGKYYYHTQEKVEGLSGGGVMRGRTNNPASRDGMRSGMVVFNEIHGYKNYDNIKVFVTGLGKVKPPRRLYATTNGDVREGPLDEMLERSLRILEGEDPDNGFLPFICRLDDKAEADRSELWVKSNPSLPYLPTLFRTIEKEYADWKSNPIANGDFMTKRMNLPQSDAAIAVTDWENIIATNRELPDMTGWECVVGIDYSESVDFTSMNMHFLRGDERYDISHSWLCMESKQLHRLTVPWREWAAAGYLTPVYDKTIRAELVCEYALKMSERYYIKHIAMDNFRVRLFERSLDEIGYSRERGNMTLVRPSDIMKVYPVIQHVFVNRLFCWGDSPLLRWATNNTKFVRRATGNFYYDKIEPNARKNDPFMALVAAMVVEDRLSPHGGALEYVPVIIA